MAMRNIVPKGCLRRAPFRAAEAQRVSVLGVPERASVSSPPVPVRIVNPLDDPLWDADLAACPGATFFHTAAWARVLASSYGFEPKYFTTRDSEGIRSLLPVMEVNSWLTGRRGVSLPFTDRVEPLASDQSSFEALYREALVVARQRSWKYLELRGDRGFLRQAPASE